MLYNLFEYLNNNYAQTNPSSMGFKNKSQEDFQITMMGMVYRIVSKKQAINSEHISHILTTANKLIGDVYFVDCDDLGNESLEFAETTIGKALKGLCTKGNGSFTHKAPLVEALLEECTKNFNEVFGDKQRNAKFKKQEIKNLKKRNITFNDRFFVSSACTLILPSHISIDKARDKTESIGTTGRGIGPAYEDKIGRRALRFGDLDDKTNLKEKIGSLVEYHNKLLDLYHQKPHDIDEVYEEVIRYEELYKNYCVDSQDLMQKWVEENRSILFEGAQGTLLDIDHGTYPYVTSSSTTAGGVSTGLGIGPKYIDKIVGISKAYTTRVGEGPFITELFDDNGKMLAERGREMYVENDRRRALIRFGKFNDAWWAKDASDAKYKLFPIPKDQIDANPKLTQNPGY